MNMLKSVLRGLVFAVGLAGAAVAQPSGVLVGPIGGGTGGSAVSLTCGTGLLCSPSPITGTGSVTPSVFQNDQVGTSYALLTTDGGKIVAGSNASAQAYSLSSASTTGFGAGYGFDLYNRGAGALTLTATTSTFGNALTTLVLATGQESYIAADSASTNYLSFVSLPVMATNTVLGNIAAANYPVALTTTQLTTLVNAFSSSLSGAVPASGGGTTNFLRADGTFAAPSGGSGCTVSGTVNQIVSNNGSSACQSSATTATTAGNIVDPFAGTASTPALLFSASPFAGSGTTSFPALYFDNNATAPTTFSTAGTYFGINSASTSNNFFDMYVGTAQKAVLSGFGVLYLAGATSGSCSTAILCTNGPIQATTFITAGTNLSAGATGIISWAGRGILSSAVAGDVQIGSTDVASPVAQTLSFQSVIAGTSNVAGANAIMNLSRGTGTGIGGNLTINGAPHSTTGSTQNALSATLTINGDTGAVGLPLLAATSAGTTGTVCWTTGGNLTVDTTTTCLLSSRRFKQNILPLQNGLSEVMNLTPVSYELKPQYNPTKLGRLPGLIAEDVMKVDPRLVGLDPKGKPHGVRYELLTAVLVKAVQQQQVEIADLQKKLAARH